MFSGRCQSKKNVCWDNRFQPIVVPSGDDPSLFGSCGRSGGNQKRKSPCQHPGRGRQGVAQDGSGQSLEWGLRLRAFFYFFQVVVKVAGAQPHFIDERRFKEKQE